METEAPVWILTGAHEGDNAQLRVLAAATGLTYVEKQLTYNWFCKLPNVLKGSGRWTMTRAARGMLSAPWPQMVMAIGRRAAPIAQWIAHAAGGDVRLVHLGRPRSRLDRFDLVITTPQYRLPKRDNVIELALPLSRLSGTIPVNDVAQWTDITQNLSPPFTALLVGGATDAYRFDADAGRQLGEEASAYVRKSGGSLLVSTSPRTSVETETALIKMIDIPFYCYRWSESRGKDNPLRGLLALADEIIVTSDSASMIADAVTAQKPIRLFEMPKRTASPLKRHIDGWFRELEAKGWDNPSLGLRLTLLRALADRGIVNPPRDMPTLIAALSKEAMLPSLGSTAGASGQDLTLNAYCQQQLSHAVARIKTLLP